MGLFNAFKKKTTKQIIIDKFYYDYPEKPYISDDRGKDWIEKAVFMPKQMLVKKSMMKRYADGLLPGHVYMLYWLKKYINKKAPVYFEYKYGIDFEKEKMFLKKNGFLDDNDTPTEKGNKAIEKHFNVIENHSQQKPKRDIDTISKQIISELDNLKKNGCHEYIFLASSDELTCEKCKALNKKHFLLSEFEIGVNAPPMHDGCRCAISGYINRSK